MTAEVQLLRAPSRRDALRLVGAGAAALGLSTSALGEASESARLHALLDRSDRADAALDLLADRPGEVRLGVGRYLDPLSAAHANALRANKREEARALQGIDRARLPAVDRIALDVFAYTLRQTLEAFETGLFEVQRQTPFNPSFGLHVAFPDHVSSGGARFGTPEERTQALGRLEAFSAYLFGAVEQAKRGFQNGYRQPRVLIENLLRQVDLLLATPMEKGPFLPALTRLPAAMPAVERERFARAWRAVVETRVYPGYRRWRDFLRETYLPSANGEPGRWALKDGDRLYAWELKRHTTTELNAEALHQIGLAEIERIRGAMEDVRREVRFGGDLKAFFDHVRTDRRYYCKTPDELLGRFRDIEARIWPAIPRLFHGRPRAPFAVAALPALGDQRGTGYYKAGPPDGVTPGVLYFNMSMLDTRPIPTLETLTLHEGIPGHHFQIMLARENAALPPLLRFGSVTAFSEGWGLYAESLGHELGLFTDPMQLFGHLDMEMLRAVRLVVDTGLHAGRWDRQRAIHYMLANTSMAPRDVAVEIDRYIAVPGQACAYKVGELRIRALRDRAERALGPAFDVRDFHAEVLATGSMPLAVLEAKIDAWIGEIQS